MLGSKCPAPLKCRATLSNGILCASPQHSTLLHNGRIDGEAMIPNQTPSAIPGALAGSSPQQGTKTTSVSSNMIVVQDALGEYNINFIEENEPEPEVFANNSILPSVVEGETRNMEGSRFRTLIHMDVGSTGSFITLSHAERIGAEPIGSSEVTLNTLGFVLQITNYQLSFVISD